MQWLTLAALAVVVATALWACWRQPAIALVLAIAAMAVPPEALRGSAPPGWSWAHTLLVVALGLVALRSGVRAAANWPVVAVVLAVAASVALGDDHQGLNLWVIMSGLGVLLLPWLVPHVVVRPQTRQLIATAIALAPPVCVVLGLALGNGLVLHDWGIELRGLDARVVGVIGDPGLMAMLAFVGLAVAVHDATVRGRAWTAVLAVVDLGLVVATGDRPILLVTGVFLLAYLRAVPGCWRILRRQAPVLAAAAAGIVLTLVLARLGFGRLGLLTAASDTGRALLWPFFWHELQVSPWFGRGIGTQMVSGAGQLAVPRPTPHSTFLGLLVDVGMIGTLLIVVAVGHWGRQLWRATTGPDRAFVGTMLAALTILAVFDDLLLWPVALPIFVYFGVLAGRQASQPTRAPERGVAERGVPEGVTEPAPAPVAASASAAVAAPLPGPLPAPVPDMAGLLVAAGVVPVTQVDRPSRPISAAQLAAVRRLAADDLWAWAAGPRRGPTTAPAEQPASGEAGTTTVEPVGAQPRT